MKTVIVLDESTWNDHAGEEYDFIISVPSDVTCETFPKYAKKIMEELSSVFEVNENEEVVAYFDASPPYRSILIDYYVIFTKQGKNFKLHNIEVPSVDTDMTDEQIMTEQKEMQKHNTK